jgi:hypothetical protein
MRRKREKREWYKRVQEILWGQSVRQGGGEGKGEGNGCKMDYR